MTMATTSACWTWAGSSATTGCSWSAACRQRVGWRCQGCLEVSSACARPAVILAKPGWHFSPGATIEASRNRACPRSPWTSQTRQHRGIHTTSRWSQKIAWYGARWSMCGQLAGVVRCSSIHRNITDRPRSIRAGWLGWRSARRASQIWNTSGLIQPWDCLRKISMGRTLAAVPTQGEDDEDDEEPPAETDSSTESKPPTGPAPHNRGAADYSTIPLGHWRFCVPGGTWYLPILDPQVYRWIGVEVPGTDATSMVLSCILDVAPAPPTENRGLAFQENGHEMVPTSGSKSHVTRNIHFSGEASFQHRSSLVPASFQHRSSIIPDYSSIAPASFQHRSSIYHLSSMVPASLQPRPSIVPASTQHRSGSSIVPAASFQHHSSIMQHRQWPCPVADSKTWAVTHSRAVA